MYRFRRRLKIVFLSNDLKARKIKNDLFELQTLKALEQKRKGSFKFFSLRNIPA